MISVTADAIVCSIGNVDITHTHASRPSVPRYRDDSTSTRRICPLLGVKRTLLQLTSMSAFDPKRTLHSLGLVYEPSSACISASALSNQNRMPISWNRLIAEVRCSVARRSPARP